MPLVYWKLHFLQLFILMMKKFQNAYFKMFKGVGTFPKFFRGYMSKTKHFPGESHLMLSIILQRK